MQTDFSRTSPSFKNQMEDLERPSLPEMIGTSKLGEGLTPMMTFDQNSKLKAKPLYKKYDVS